MFCHIILFSFFKNYLFYYHFWFAYTNWFCRNNQDLPANVAKRGILCLLDRKLWGVLQPGCWLSVQKFHHIWRAIALNARRRLPLKKQTNKQKTRIKANAISGSAQRPICTLDYGQSLEPHCGSDFLDPIHNYLCIHSANISWWSALHQAQS